jgi:hypothetical protein
LWLTKDYYRRPLSSSFVSAVSNIFFLYLRAIGQDIATILTMADNKIEKAELVSELVESISYDEKFLSTAYVADTARDSHHKSKAERRLVLKADCLIVPLAALIYFVAYLVRELPCIKENTYQQYILIHNQDRNSIGNARLMGLQADLDMNDDQYFNCLMLFCKLDSPSDRLATSNGTSRWLHYLHAAG